MKLEKAFLFIMSYFSIKNMGRLNLQILTYTFSNLFFFFGDLIKRPFKNPNLES